MSTVSTTTTTAIKTANLSNHKALALYEGKTAAIKLAAYGALTISAFAKYTLECAHQDGRRLNEEQLTQEQERSATFWAAIVTAAISRKKNNNLPALTEWANRAKRLNETRKDGAPKMSRKQRQQVMRQCVTELTGVLSDVESSVSLPFTTRRATSLMLRVCGAASVPQVTDNHQFKVLATSAKAAYELYRLTANVDYLTEGRAALVSLRAIREQEPDTFTDRYRRAWASCARHGHPVPCYRS